MPEDAADTAPQAALSWLAWESPVSPARVRRLPVRLPPLAARLLGAVLVAAALLVGAAPRSASADTATAPYGMIVLLQIRMPSTSVTCTGFMVGPHTIATAAHCLYNRELGGWASSAFVTPGLDGLNAPYGTEWATSFAVAPGWVEREELESDYGAITLGTDALGQATGWFDIEQPTDLELGRGRFATAGYGSVVPPTTLWRMPSAQGLVEWDRQFIAYVWGTSTGVSGAPIYAASPDGRYRAVGLVKGALRSRSERLEFGVRITTAVQEFLREQVARPAAAPVQQTVPTMFTTSAGTAVRVTSPMTRPETESVLQASADQVTWDTVARATTDARGVATYTVTPTATRFYRVVVRGVGTGRVGRGVVAGAAPGAPPGAGGAGTFAAPPVYSPSRVALAVFRGGSLDELAAALSAARASAAWVQDGGGTWRLYVVGGTFVNDAFRNAFPDGFSGATPMTLVAA